MTKEEFLKKAISKHGDKYEYSLVPDTIRSTDSITLICNEKYPWGESHGCFSVQASKHLHRGDGCPKCSGKYKRNKEDFVKEATYIHGGLYTYDKFDWVNTATKGIIHCTKHNLDFEMTPSHHLDGQGCPKCRYEKASASKTKPLSKFVEEARIIHGDKYDYHKSEYIDGNTKLCIICPKHGEFWQTPNNHLHKILKEGCPECGKEKTSDSHRYTQHEFIQKCNEVHNFKYDYSQTVYVNSNSMVDVICKKHGLFTQKAANHLWGQGCPKCACYRSEGERNIEDFVKGLGVEVITSNRTILNGDELDIYLPNEKVAFEYNGLYWHSENYKNANYHLDKTNRCAAKGIQLIHIFEDEWQHKQDIVKSRIKYILGKCDSTIYARKCCIMEVDNATSNDFLNKNHLQGQCNNSKYRYGLFYNGELVSLMTFGKLRKNLGSTSTEGIYELLRFCNKLNVSVIGGASKLFKYFRNKVNPNAIISYADRRWSNGNLYENLKFNLSHISQPSYFYVVNGKRENRFKYRKDILVQRGFDSNKSERQIMEERGIPRIYDCGCLCYKWIKQ